MSAHGSRLAAITRDLWTHWQHTREYWSDQKSQEFQKRYLEELVPSVDKTVAVIEQLDKLLAKMKKDCE